MDSFGTFIIYTCIPACKKVFLFFRQRATAKKRQKNITATRKETEARRVESVDPIFKVRDLARSSSDIQGLKMALFLFLATRERGGRLKAPPLPPPPLCFVESTSLLLSFLRSGGGDAFSLSFFSAARMGCPRPPENHRRKYGTMGRKKGKRKK